MSGPTLTGQGGTLFNYRNWYTFTLPLTIRPLDDPRSIGAALAGSRLGDFWKYRVGDYRIIASIENDILTVLVVSVGHRRLVYRR
jgi:mRNA-degrading endonuclease RelE of RelBE toxin-antitoxin system